MHYRPVVMLLYPLYASVKAIESESKDDDQQWLTYWILYSFFALLEMVAAPVFTWIPFWSSVKLVCACWLVLPQFRGAYNVYEWFIRGKLLKHKSSFMQSLSESQRRFLQLLNPEARALLEQYIQENGMEAFDNVIAAANKEAYKNPFA